MIVGLSMALGLGAGTIFPEYRQVQERLQQGWNTWDSRSVLRQVLLPEGLAVNLSFKQQRWLEEPFLERALIGRTGKGEPVVRPGLHALDGSYQELSLEWEDLSARVRTCHDGGDLVIRIDPLNKTRDPVRLVVSLGMLWNCPGTLGRDGDVLLAGAGGKEHRVFVSAAVGEDPYVPMQTPYLVVDLEKPLVVSTGRRRGPDEAEDSLRRARNAMERFAVLADAFLAIESTLGWNTVYEPRHQRVVSTVGRLWNEEYGGYCLFGWDNFFLAYLCCPFSRDLALANVMEHLESATEEGFIPNDDRGNGSKSFDRSQPPVGGIMVREVLKCFPEPWLMEASFPVLLKWNRWWPRKRGNGALLSYGSHRTENPFHEPQVGTRVTAGYESGMDDSPMYEGVPFNETRGILELQDVGLTSLYIADCQALAEMAGLLGRKAEARELRQRAGAYRRALETLWSGETGYYLNRRSDTGAFSNRRSPTLFFPLLTGRLPRGRVRALLSHFHNPAEFAGDWILPSITRDDPAYPRQRYWKGAIWPPLNYLTYLGLRRSGLGAEARLLAEKSGQLFIQEWRRKGYVSENYSAIAGSGDDTRLSSDRFHSWGALMGVMALVESGSLPVPEQDLYAAFGRKP